MCSKFKIPASKQLADCTSIAMLLARLDVNSSGIISLNP